MKKTGIFYGSSTGMTTDVARRLAKLLDVADADIHDVAKTSPVALGDYDILVLGTSTHGLGELQEDWYDFLNGAAALDLKGKKIAIFGLGDETMADTFCNAVGELYERLKGTGAEFIGEFPADVYTYSHSDATDGATMRGLLLDEVNHPDYTPRRLEAWAEIIRKA